jgi:hypothetical protein
MAQWIGCFRYSHFADMSIETQNKNDIVKAGQQISGRPGTSQ